MKKLTVLFLGIALIFAMSCSSGLNPEVSQSGESGGDSGGDVVKVVKGPDDLISINESGVTASESDLTDFIMKYRKTYYNDTDKYPRNIEYVVTYPTRLPYCVGTHETYYDRQVSWFVPQMAIPSEGKLQISNYARGEVRVLNFTEEGLESYTSYMLEKVNDIVLIQNSGIGGKIPALAQYQGTYNSIARDNKVNNYVAIDKDGSIYFYDASITIANGNAEIKDGKLAIWDKSNRKIVFKFDQGVYRIYSADGNTDMGYVKCYTSY